MWGGARDFRGFFGGGEGDFSMRPFGVGKDGSSSSLSGGELKGESVSDI